jgi:hypothetical protein
MILENKDKSRQGNKMRTEGRRLPAYAVAGLVSMLVFEGLLFSGHSLVGMYFTPLQWTGLILFLDGVVKVRRGTSLLSRHFGEFVILAAVSIGSWVIFEWYNVALENWRYAGLPDNPWVRYSGYAWAFATISPGMFLIYEVIDSFVPGSDPKHRPRLPDPVFYPFVAFGLACLVVPVVWPSPYMTPLVWMGFAFFLDPINGRLGERSILSEFFTGHFRSMPLFFLSGLVAGLLWEFWNYWASSRWEYSVPYLGHVKLFEMPVLGFLGFMPFIIESFAIYTFVRRLLPTRREVRYLG